MFVKNSTLVDVWDGRSQQFCAGCARHVGTGAVSFLLAAPNMMMELMDAVSFMDDDTSRVMALDFLCLDKGNHPEGRSFCSPLGANKAP